MSNLGQAVILEAARGSLALAQDPRRPAMRAGVSVIDVCHGAGAAVILATPGILAK